MPKLPLITWSRSPVAMTVEPAARIAACRAALARGGGTDATGALLLDALIETERFEEALDFARKQPKPPGADPYRDLQLALVFEGAGQVEAALGHVEAALAVAPDDPGLALRQAELLIRLRRDGAEAAVDALAGRVDVRLSPAMVATLRRRHGAAYLLDLTERRPGLFNSGDRLDCRLRGLMAVGRVDEAMALMDIDRLLECRRLEPEVSNTALALEIEGLGSITNPSAKATHEGRQSTAVLASTRHAPRVLAAVRVAVADYLAAPTRRGNPFIAAAPRYAMLKALAVVLGPGGRQAAHYHPAGWLSGVYYVSTPDVDAEAGSLVVGLPPDEPDLLPWEPRTLTPRAGDLILFPSSFRHLTLPHRGEQPRISVAFDVVPAVSEA